MQQVPCLHWLDMATMTATIAMVNRDKQTKKVGAGRRPKIIIRLLAAIRSIGRERYYFVWLWTRP